MLITRTPFRVSFVGGGTDAPWFYQKNGKGSVLSMAIKQYMYIVIHPYFHPNFHNERIRLKYSSVEDVSNADEVEHKLIRACLQRVDVPKGIEIASFADIPAGTGLGSSSAFTVGLLHALYAWRGEIVPKERIAKEACEIEIDILKNPIGKQDQYASAVGGMNEINFYDDESVEINPISINKARKEQLEANLRLYYLGLSREAHEILAVQNSKDNLEQKYTVLNQMLSQVEELKTLLSTDDIQGLGAILNQAWMRKKTLTKQISSSEIDSIYEKAMQNGARGGKLLGAGGTGFLLLDSDNHQKLEKELGLVGLPLRLDREGTKVLMHES